jgi:hypothetical protein
MKNAIFRDVVPCGSCVNRRFGGTYRLHLQSRKIRERGTSLIRWLQRRGYVHPKRRFAQDLHGATYQRRYYSSVTEFTSTENAKQHRIMDSLIKEAKVYGGQEREVNKHVWTVVELDYNVKTCADYSLDTCLHSSVHC